MITRHLMSKSPFRSQTLRAIACAVVVAVATILLSQLLGLPAPPGVAAALGAIAGASCLANSKRK
jgi:hypothetical protein